MTDNSRVQDDRRELERPEVVSLRWLIDNVPVRLWLWAGGAILSLLVATFYAGQESSNVDSEQSINSVSLFSKGYPYPHPFRGFPIGTMPVELMSAFPDVEYHVAPFEIPFPEGPFELALFELGEETVNPPIESVRFIIRRDADGRTSQEASIEIWRQVMEAFQSYSFEKSDLENQIHWSNVYGKSLTLTDSEFRVEKSAEWQPLPGGRY